MKPYIELTKPRITWLILLSTAVGYWFGASDPAVNSRLLYVLLGTGLMASGTAALNQWAERRTDALMHRTRWRPLPSGRIKPGYALAWGSTLAAGGAAVLAAGVNALAALLGVLTLGIYLVLYTPLKSRTPHATTVGALAGAIPPLIGYAGSAGRLGAEAWLLAAILFVWQFPHFYAIGWLYREDYARAGIRMLPVVDKSGERTARQIVVALLVLLPLSVGPGLLSMTGTLYVIGALAASLAFLYPGLRIAAQRTAQRARGVLIASVIYLPVLYGLMLADRAGW